MITSSGSIAAADASRARAARRRSLDSHQSSVASSVSPVAVSTPPFSSPMRRRCSITSGTPPAMNTCAVGRPRRPVRQRVDEARRRAVDADPVLDRRRRQAGGGGDRRDVQQQIRRAAERGVHEHRVLDGGVGEDLRRPRCRAHASRRSAAAERLAELEPDRLARRRERAVRQRQAQRFGDHLRRRRGPEKLASAAGRSARAAAHRRPRSRG